jgi:hypothetical protein
MQSWPPVTVSLAAAATEAFNRHTKHFAISCGHKNHFNWLNFHLFLLFFLLQRFTETLLREG